MVGAGTGMGLISRGASAHTIPKTILDSTTRLSGQAFGTRWQVTLPDATRLAPVAAEIRRTVNLINKTLSPWNPDSDISRFNCADEHHWVSVSPICSHVIQHALDVASASDGAFDPTIGPLVHRYGFGPIAGQAQSDYQAVDVRLGGLCKKQAELTLDPCGIAKGYALDLMGEALLELGIEQHLIEIGGELRASSTHPSGRSWVTGIEVPQGDTSEPFLRLTSLAGKSLATSGVRYNSYNVSQRRYSHIMDPGKGQPVFGPLLSVSVIAHSAMHADAWSTALMAAGQSEGLLLAKQLELDALFISDTVNNGPAETATHDGIPLPDGRGGYPLSSLHSVATGNFEHHVLSSDTL